MRLARPAQTSLCRRHRLLLQASTRPAWVVRLPRYTACHKWCVRLADNGRKSSAGRCAYHSSRLAQHLADTRLLCMQSAESSLRFSAGHTKSGLLSKRKPHSSAGAGSRSTRRTWMMCDDAERQMGSRPLCTMATCWPPTTNFRFLSSWIALPSGTCKASARVPSNQCISVQHKRLTYQGRGPDRLRPPLCTTAAHTLQNGHLIRTCHW